MDSGFYPPQMERHDWSDSFVYVTMIIIILIIMIIGETRTRYWGLSDVTLLGDMLNVGLEADSGI